MTHLKVGDKAPNFSGVDQDGNTISLADYAGKKLVVFFYPKASTPGCTAEACNLNDNYDRFKAQGYEILGVSADSAKRQSNFKNKYGFQYPLLADEDKSVIEAFGRLTITPNLNINSSITDEFPVTKLHRFKSKE